MHVGLPTCIILSNPILAVFFHISTCMRNAGLLSLEPCPRPFSRYLTDFSSRTMPSLQTRKAIKQPIHQMLFPYDHAPVPSPIECKYMVNPREPGRRMEGGWSLKRPQKNTKKGDFRKGRRILVPLLTEEAPQTSKGLLFF